MRSQLSPGFTLIEVLVTLVILTFGLLGIAGLMAAVGSGIAAIQVFIPKLSFRAHVPEPYGSLLDSFVHAFLGVFLVGITGWLNEPSLATWKAALVAALTGGITAGLRAIQGALTPGEQPAPKMGFKVGKAAKEGTPKLAPA